MREVTGENGHQSGKQDLVTISSDPLPAHGVAFGEAVRVWIRVALLSFGGPAGQIAVMHRILVEEKRWISENRFLHAMNFCMLLPGPEAQQLATYIGWLMHRALGGLVAGTLFILPGFVSILVLSILYAGYHDLALVKGIFSGLKPAVVAVVVEAVLRIGKRSLKNRTMIALAAAAFIAIFFLQVPFPLIVLVAGSIGLLGGRMWPETFVVLKGHATTGDAGTHVISDAHVSGVRPTARRAIRVAAVWLALWWGPIACIWLLAGSDSVYTQESLFFSKAAVVTFGGAYAVLAYVAQQGVNTYGWLRPGEMLDGLGMAETTPGPLIQVVQFVGFLGAYRNPGPFDPLVAGIIGSIITTWVTFTPCFLWIFVGAPYIEALRGRPTLNAALSSITAAVVGVVLNLSVWFALHTLFAEVNERHALGMRFLIPSLPSVDIASVAIATAAFVAMFRFKVGMLTTLAASAMLGSIYFFLFR